MQPISIIIKDMLYVRDCVIVPGLGAFITRRVPSHYDERRGLMLPPRKEVAFNPDIRHTDGMLADTIAGREGVDYDMAQRTVEDFAQEVRQTAEAGGVYMLAELGSIVSIDDRLVFEPANGLNVLPDSYGLAPVAAQRLKPALFSTLGKVSAPEVRKVAASAAAVAALLMISPKTNDPQFVRADFTQVFELSGAAGTSPKESTPRVDERPTDMTEQVEMAQPMANAYYVVVASFLTQREANDYIASMRARGVTDLDVLDLDGRCRVVAASFDNPDKAQRATTELRALQGFEKAWVLHVGE